MSGPAVAARPASSGHALAVLLAAGAAALAGLMWPDFDRVIGLGHRSALTHSLLLPLLIALGGRRSRLVAGIAAGLALGIAIHCSADLFPHAMRGFALVKLPGIHGLGWKFSYAWLGTTVALGLLVPLWWVETRFGDAALAGVAAAVLLLGGAYIMLHHEPYATAAALGGGVVLAHPAGRRAAAARLWRRDRSGSALK